MKERQPAICLRTSDFSETSQVAHFLTRSAGIVRLLAKGAKRSKSKTGGAIDLLSEGDLVYIPSARETLGTLVEFTETAVHTPLRRDAVRLAVALYLIELPAEMLAEADPFPEVFDLLHNALARLAEPDAPLQAVLAYCQWRFLKLAGLLGDLKTCVACGATPDLSGAAGRGAYFTSFQGGLLCEACEGAAAEKYRLDGPTLAGLAALATVETGVKAGLSEKQALAVNRLLAYHVSQQIGRPLRMARHVLGADTNRP
jgi:DNA repair protein RecO (recombination protein O)